MIKKSPFILLEILIGIALVALVIPPLLQMQTSIYIQSKEFRKELVLSKTILHHFCFLQEKLYEGSISLESIRENKEIPTIQEDGFTYTHPIHYKLLLAPHKDQRAFIIKISYYNATDPKLEEPFSTYLLAGEKESSS